MYPMIPPEATTITKQVKDDTIIDGRLPLYVKPVGKLCYVFNPNNDMYEVNKEKDKFFIPYYRVKKTEIEKWLDKMSTMILLAKSPIEKNEKFEGVLLSYFDQDGEEPRFGGAFYVTE